MYGFVKKNQSITPMLLFFLLFQGFGCPCMLEGVPSSFEIIEGGSHPILKS